MANHRISTVRLLSLGISFLVMISLSGCNMPGGGAPDANILPTATPTPILGSNIGEPSQEPPSGCPTELMLYDLWFSHLAVLDIGSGMGESMYLKFENIPPSLFQVWIEPSGNVTNENIVAYTEIGYEGLATHPDSNDCPEQIFSGVWGMRATITGTCQGDKVTLHIVEEWIDPTLQSSCGDFPAAPGIYSAPELDLTFDLREHVPMDGIEAGQDGSPFYASYAYSLSIAEGDGLPIVPLVPDQ